MCLSKLVPFIPPQLQPIFPKEVHRVSPGLSLLEPRPTHSGSQIVCVRASAVVHQSLNLFEMNTVALNTVVLATEIGSYMFENFRFGTVVTYHHAFEAPYFAECGKTGWLVGRDLKIQVSQLLAIMKQPEGPLGIGILRLPSEHNRCNLLTACMSDTAEKVEETFGARKKKTILAVEDMEGFEIDLTTDTEDRQVIACLHQKTMDIENRAKGFSS